MAAATTGRMAADFQKVMAYLPHVRCAPVDWVVSQSGRARGERMFGTDEILWGLGSASMRG